MMTACSSFSVDYPGLDAPRGPIAADDYDGSHYWNSSIAASLNSLPRIVSTRNQSVLAKQNLCLSRLYHYDEMVPALPRRPAALSKSPRKIQ